MSAFTYEVSVTREGNQWLAEVTNRTGIQTFARTYAALRHDLEEAIRLMDDLDDDDVVLTDTTFENIEPDFATAASIGEERKEAERHAASLAVEAALAAQRLQTQGFSLRDISGALAMTPGRVSQILSNPPKATVPDGTTLEEIVRARGGMQPKSTLAFSRPRS